MSVRTVSRSSCHSSETAGVVLLLSVLLLLQLAVYAHASSWQTIAELDGSALALLPDNATAIVVGGASVYSVNIRGPRRFGNVTIIAQNSSADYRFTAVAVSADSRTAYVTADTLSYDANSQLQGRLYEVGLKGEGRGRVQQLIGDTDYAFTGIALTADGQVFITGAQVPSQTGSQLTTAARLLCVMLTAARRCCLLRCVCPQFESYYFLPMGPSALLQTAVSNFSRVQKRLLSSQAAYTAIAITADSSTAYVASVHEQGEDNQVSSLLRVSLADFTSHKVTQQSHWGWQGVALSRNDSTAYVVASNPTGLYYESELDAVALPSGGLHQLATDSPNVCALAINAAGTTAYAIQCESQLLSYEL